ncbi:hypothetical protein EDD21DRAFT_428285 [Dissophora ornata]|nr:hypothetical protein EDD21DRAFT_428285 [Dissophora ornata]
MGCLPVRPPEQRLEEYLLLHNHRQFLSEMTKQKKASLWRNDAQSLPYAQYFLSESKPQNFNHVAFLVFLQPSSHQRRDITNHWLQVVIPALKNSVFLELRQAGHRLTTEWTSKKVIREAFWTNLVSKEEKEEQERAKQKRMAHLKSAGEKRLQATENFLVEDTLHDFELEIARLQKGSPSPEHSKDLASDEKVQEQYESRTLRSSVAKQIETRLDQQEQEDQEDHEEQQKEENRGMAPSTRIRKRSSTTADSRPNKRHPSSSVNSFCIDADTLIKTHYKINDEDVGAAFHDFQLSGVKLANDLDIMVTPGNFACFLYVF